MSAPRLYEKEITRNRTFSPIYRGGEVYSFYMNFDMPITDPNFDDFQLGVYKGDARISEDIGMLVKDTIIGIAYNIYSTFLFPITIPDGCYTFCIYRASNNAIMCRSNVITVDNHNYDKASVLKWRNAYNKFNFNYEANPAFLNIFRLVLIEVDRQSESDLKQYRSVSDRRLRNSASDLDFYVKIETYRLDKEAHDAMATIFQQDQIDINGSTYIAKTQYSIDTNLNTPVFNGSVELYEVVGVATAEDWEPVPDPIPDPEPEPDPVEPVPAVIPYTLTEGEEDFLDNNLLFNIGDSYSNGFFNAGTGEFTNANIGDMITVQQNYYGGTTDSNGNPILAWPYPVTCKLQLLINGVPSTNPAYNLVANFPADQPAPAGLQSFTVEVTVGMSINCTVEPQVTQSAETYPYPVTETLVARSPDNITKPGYLEPVTDSAFPGVKLTIVSSGSTFGVTGAYKIDTGYSKRSPWSRNGSWLRVGTRHLLDGNNYSYVDLMDTTYKLWSNVHDNISWNFYKSGLIQRTTINSNGTQSAVNWMNVSALVSGYDTTYNMTVGNYEGNLSMDDKYVIVQIKQSGVVKQALLNLETKSVVWVDTLGVGAYGFDWVTVTPSGLYIITNELDGAGSTLAKKSYDLNRNLIQSNLGIHSHRDVGFYADGREALFGTLESVAYDVVSGTRTNLLPNMATVLGGNGGHSSGRAFDMKGWMLHSMTSNTAFYKEILYIKADGSGHTMRLASARLSEANKDYGPQAAPNFDGTKFLFGSDWNNSSGPVEAVVGEVV